MKKVKPKSNLVIRNRFNKDVNDDFIRGYELASEWIPISERLPNKEMEILIKCEGCGGYNFKSVYKFDPEYFTGKFNVNGVVTHWRKI